MGQSIDREHFTEEDFRLFSERVQRGLAALEEVLARPGFGAGPASLGGELEMCLVDANARPLGRNLSVLERAGDPRLCDELNRFNLECNLEPVGLVGQPFSRLGREMEEVLEIVRRSAAAEGGRVVTVGILPTLAPEDLQSDAMTDNARYRALSAGLRRLRDSAFDVVIDGEDPLNITCDDVTFEGANTALQVHLRVEPGDFVDVYNAMQIATAPVLAAAGNSPVFLEHRLWEETRVALFKQAVDARDDVSESWRPARVSFGNGWVRETALELFAEGAALHQPLLPVVSDEDPLDCVRRGGTPELSELRLHHGTVWSWNRAIYDPRDGGHLRIELRALPSGPTVTDMLANIAFALGLTYGILGDVDWMTPALPFEHAERNFYRAAQHGLDAILLWPSREPPSPQPLRAPELIRKLLPVARRGLESLEIERDEADRLLGVIEERVESRCTGSLWQRRMLARLEPEFGRRAGLEQMLQRYLAASESGEPVHRWPLD